MYPIAGKQSRCEHQNKNCGKKRVSEEIKFHLFSPCLFTQIILNDNLIEE
jgi:hypothetical protein